MSKNIPSETFCVLPFMHVAISPSGSFRVCCNSDPNTNKIWKTENKEYKYFRDDVNEVWNSDVYKTIRKQLINGERPDMCVQCFREEDVGIKSPRIGHNNKWFKDDIIIAEEIPLDVRYIDIRLGNLCNLKCRMCNPWSSSQWVKDWNKVIDTAELQPSAPLSIDDIAWLEVLGEWPDRKNTANNFIEIANTIEEIYLTGGEPTLAVSQYKLFDYCIEHDLASNIKLKYNTNLTNVPEKMLEYWKHFKQVQLNCSIDAYGDRNRYIRYPSNWEKITENFDTLNALPNVNIEIHCTVQVLNMCALNELFDWALSRITPDQIYLNILNHPDCMNIRTLPTRLKKTAEDNLSEYLHIPKVVDIISYMYAEDWYDKRWTEFVAFNKKTDTLQKGDLLKACPEFIEFMPLELDNA